MQTLQLVTAQQTQTQTQQQAIAQQIQQMLANVSTTFAQILYTTKVATSAKHKHINITKVTRANVQLFSNINAFTDVYANAVKRSAQHIQQAQNANVSNFATQQNYFTHTQCYSILQHNTNGNLYLYAIFNNANSVYYINNTVATKQQVAQYLTASAQQQLLSNNNVVHNVTNNVLHTVQVRTIALHNINSITACRQTVTF
jgi:hypothetical protein